MKKTVIIILAVLPIFLLITISFAGRIFSYYQHVSVEKIRFVDDNGLELNSGYVFTLNVGEKKQPKIKVYPEYSTNKKINYLSDNEEVLTVDKEGQLQGVSFGTATLIARSEDGSKTATLIVKVTQDGVTGVYFTVHEIELNVGEKQNLTAIVTPYVALNKSVKYSSDNAEIVEINANGQITAISAGTATVKVKTVDGGFEDYCVITCVQNPPALYFDVSNDENFEKKGVGYALKVKEIYLLDYLRFDEEKIIIDEVNFRISSGEGIATLSGDKLTVTGKGIIKIVAHVGSQSSPTYQADLMLLIQ